MKKKLLMISKHPAVMTIQMTGAIVIGGIFGYLFQIYTMKYLPDSEFLEFQRYLAYMNIVGSIFAGLTIYMSTVALSYKHNLALQKSLRERIYSTFRKHFVLLVGISCVTIFIAYVFFDLRSPDMLILIAIQAFVSACAAAMTGVLRGFQWFLPLLLVQLTGPLLKLGSGLFLIAMDRGSFGALLACILSGVLPLFMILFFIHQRYKGLGGPSSNHQVLQVKFQELLSSSIIVILLGFLMNIDVIMVHKVVSGELASQFVGISLLFKSLVFILGALEIVFLSSLVEQGSIKNIVKIVMAIIFCCAAAIVIESLLGGIVIGFMKESLLTSRWLLMPGLLLMGLYGIISILGQYIVLSYKKNYSILMIIALCIVVRYIVISFQLIQGFLMYILSLFVLFTTILSSLFIFLITNRKNKKSID